MDFLQITIKVFIGFLAYLVIIKLIGKTQLSQISPYHFISAIVLGEILGNAIYDNSIKVQSVLFTFLLWTLLMYLVEMVGLRYFQVRTYIQGNPSVLIRNGQIDREQLKENKVTINQLQLLLRKQGVFSIREVEYALLESDGQVSVLRKYQFDTPERQDWCFPDQKIYLPVTVISDGKVLEDNLKDCGLDRSTLDEKLSALGICSLHEVFYAEWVGDDGLYISKS